MSKKFSNQDFINRARAIHGDRYDYSLIEYKNQSTNVKLICHEHGEFEQMPMNHLSGKGCRFCSKNVKLTLEQFVARSVKIHGNKYEYSSVTYSNNRSKVEIICREHGPFHQMPSHHMEGSGCPKCNAHKRAQYDSKMHKKFIDKAIKIHDGKYGYDKSYYINSREKITITCNKHGDFDQRPSHHLAGSGCLKCGVEVVTNKKLIGLTTFINRAIAIHGAKFDYTKSRYINKSVNVIIVCPIHGDFEQTPHNHTHGKQGCPRCKSSTGEREVMRLLELHGISYVSQKKFEECKDKRPLVFDFYIPDMMVCIEYDGILHSEPHEHFGGQDKFMDRKRKDGIKNEFCMKHNIDLLRIGYKENVSNVLLEFLKLKRHKGNKPKRLAA